ncbi:hypothetical protein D3C87_1965560 [compost metagenome]
MVSGLVRSMVSISTFGMPWRFFFAFSISLATTITVAPAAASTFVVSRPMPALPPVTMTTFPVRLMSFMTSAAVVVALKPEPSGCCNAPW